MKSEESLARDSNGKWKILLAPGNHNFGTNIRNDSKYESTPKSQRTIKSKVMYNRCARLHELSRINHELTIKLLFGYIADNQEKSEDIQVHKNDDQLILNYMSRFDELKAKYAGTSSSLNTKARTNQQKIRQKSIQERVRAFVSLLNECDLSAYDLEYIKTFKDYWTEEVKPNKLRFETKADFIMLIELDSWSNLNVQIADEKEYNRFLAEANEKAHKEYQRYLGSLNTNYDDIELSTDNDLKYLETEFNKNIEQYKTTFLKRSRTYKLKVICLCLYKKLSSSCCYFILKTRLYLCSPIFGNQ